MASNILKKVNARIKAIHRAHPSMTFKQAAGKAWAEYRAGKISGTGKKKRKPAKRRAKAKKAKRTRRRIGTTSSPHVDRVDKKKVEISIGTVAGHKAKAARLLKERLSRQLLAREMAQTSTAARRCTRHIAKTRQELRALGY